MAGDGLSRDELVDKVRHGEILEGVDLSGADLAGLPLAGAIFEKANLTGAILAGADLHESVFNDTVLSEADLSTSNLRHANAIGCTATATRFSGALMLGFKSIDCAFERAVFDDVDLTLGAFVNPIITDARFHHAKLERCSFLDAQTPRVDFGGALMKNTVVMKADLTEANFTGAALEGAIFIGSRLAGKDLRGLDLTLAQLMDADLRGVDLSDCLSLIHI